jgi:hypothetical protein
VDNSTTPTIPPEFIGILVTIYAVIIFATMALFVWLFWRIFVKAGMSGPLALLNLIPGFGMWICLFILAFGTWQNQAGMPQMVGYNPQPPGRPLGGPPMNV